MDCMEPRENDEIVRLTEALEAAPEDYELYMRRGRLYRERGLFPEALNDFIRASELRPEDGEAAAHAAMIREILEYRYNDIYNP